MKNTVFMLGALSIVLVGCSSNPIVKDGSGGNLLEQGSMVTTLTNLRADPVRSKLSAVNYQLDVLIPLCSEVQVEDLSKKRFEFILKETGKRYYYDYHKAAVDTFGDHLALYFGSECNEAEINGMSEIDKQGIQAGKALPGMTKQGVIYAIGYPPKHRTPTLELQEWRYWRNRFNTFVVHFDDAGVVTSIAE